MIAVTLAFELLLMNLIGIFIRKSKITNKDFTDRLTAVVMKFCIPCLIFYSISNATEFSTEALSNCLVVILLGAAALLISLGAGQIFHLLHHKSGYGRIVRYGLTFSNFSFMGIPVMAALFGETGTFYYAFFLIPIRIGYYALSEQLMTPPTSNAAKKSAWKSFKEIFLSPQLLAVLFGLVFWVCNWSLPTAINYCVKSLYTISSPLALLLCGMVIAEYDFKKMLRLDYLKLPLLRIIMMPALFFALSRLLLLWGVDEMLCQMLVIYNAFPTASLMAVYAVKYDSNPENHLLAAGTCVISVLLSAITVPFWYMILS